LKKFNQSEKLEKKRLTIHIDHEHKNDDAQTQKRQFIAEKTKIKKTKANIIIIVIRDSQNEYLQLRQTSAQYT
jgi:hypothetical protein